ncbi:MAG: YfhO family protein, partial [Clostridiales bacterium]|nr:YfhO family protein [Clostridiales bacterium]
GNYFLGIMSFFNWMDTLILFPVLLILVERMIETGKWKLYYIFLTVAIVCNFYIAFPVCIFVLFWFLLQILSVSKDRKKRTITFLGSSLLAGISAMGIIIPCVVNVGSRYSAGSEDKVSAYIHSVLEVPYNIFKRFFVFTYINEGNVLDTAFYMSVGMIVVCTMFFFVKMERKIKYAKLGMAVFMMLSLFIGVFNYMWHGFSIPHTNNHRYVFALIFLLLVMALDVLVHLEDLKIWQCILGLVVHIIVFVYTFISITVYEDFYVYFATAMLIIFDFILLVLFCRKSVKKSSFIIVFLSLCIVEVTVNAFYQFRFYDVEKTEDSECVKEAFQLAKDVSLEKGQRMAFVHAGHNLGMSVGIPSTTGFASYANGKMNTLNHNLGMRSVPDAGLLYSGGSPLLNLMFNVGCGIGASDTEFSDCSFVKTEEPLKLYKIDRLAGLGYMVEESVEDWKTGERVPFEAQNNFVKCALNSDDEVFHILKPEVECATSLGALTPMTDPDKDYAVPCQYTPLFEQDGNIIQLTADHDMDLYVNLQGSTYFTAVVSVDDEQVYQNNSIKIGQLTIHVGRVKKNQKITIVCGVQGQAGNEVLISAQFAEFDDAVYQKVYEKLSHSVYEITDMKSDYISGTIDADRNGIMMTSVQAVKGFTVYVDGEKTDYKTIGGALIGVPLQKGKHTVEFRYQTPYAWIAWLISGFGFLIFAIICLVGRKKNVSVFCKTESIE